MQWIVWSPSAQTGLLIIPEEAELLIPILRLAGLTTKAHLITYAAPITKNMLHFNSLRYFTMPPLPKDHVFPKWFRLELGLFTGRLYVSFDECLEIVGYLKALGRRNDASNMPVSRLSKGETAFRFSNNPIGFLLEWLALRRQVQDILQTPMGYICKGSKLHRNHPFFATPKTDGLRPMAEHSSTNSSADASNDSDDDYDYDFDDDEYDEHLVDDSSQTMEEPEYEGAQDGEDVDFECDSDI